MTLVLNPCRHCGHAKSKHWTMGALLCSHGNDPRPEGCKCPGYESMPSTQQKLDEEWARIQLGVEAQIEAFNCELVELGLPFTVSWGWVPA